MEIFIKFMGRMLVLVLEYIAITFVISSILIFIRGRNDKKTKAEYLIILGCKVNGDVPSNTLMLRIEKAYEYLITNPDAVAIASGASVSEGQNKTEAQVIFDRLVEKGIAPERIALEEKARTTYENFVYSKRLIKEIEVGKPIDKIEIAFVSSDYHILRAFSIAYKTGLHVRCVAAKSPKHKIKYCIKEYLQFYPLIFNRLDRNNIEENDED